MGLTWSESYKLLLDGDYDNGWPDHNIIPVQNNGGIKTASNYGKTVWDGEEKPITLLINAEFGDGDTIQYYRFVELAKKKVSKVLLRCNSEFKNLFPEVEVISSEEKIPEFDEIIHMMALPKVLSAKKNEINGKPYLKPNSAIVPCKEIQTLSLMKLSKFGINWAGNPFNPRDRIRSIPVELFQKLETKNIPLFSLNKLYQPPKQYLDCRGIMNDWNETAHLISLMSLVITVETSIACLAGALGVPVWVLIPTEEPEYRWGKEGNTTLWYESMKLYRKQGSWEETMSQVALDFKEFLSHSSDDVHVGLSCAPSSVTDKPYF